MRARSLAAMAGLVPLLAVGLAAAQAPTTPPVAPGAKPETKKSEDRQQPLTVDADRMERYGKESLVIFTGNVIARQSGSIQYSDRMEVYLDEKGDKVLRTVSTGAVRITTKDCRMGTARRVEYFDLEQRMVLIGNARVWQEDNVVTGETITIFLSQDRSVVQGGKQERVKAVFYQKPESSSTSSTPLTASTSARPGDPSKPPAPAATPCG
ncbi:MAG: lipopolysaccharide transport periplasmic protein LptA [Candidatus Rokuibacteriota bacterium]|nr:MAG: lipopolysaccharide transport periplasmic protein LptA [Candidatus Rokubacteria bacterium]